MSWKIDDLKKALNARRETKGWIIHRDTLERRERYFLMDRGELATDQDREVKNLAISARIFVKKESPQLQGEIRKKFFPEMPLEDQIDSAIQAAVQTNVKSWELPAEVPGEIPELKTADPEISEDIEGAMEKITAQVRELVGQKRNSNFNSAELFLSLHHRESHLSNGLTHRSSQTRIYAEAAYSASKTGSDGNVKSDEYLNTLWSVSLKDMPLEKLFGDAAQNAERVLNVSDVTAPKSGRYPVIFHADVLSTLMNGHMNRLSAFNAYHGLPFRKPGEELIPEAEGDLLSITSDPTLDYGALTDAFTEQGILQAPLPLVRDNRVIASLADKQYAQYLGIRPGTASGNVVIEPGSLSIEEMRKREPMVLEIVQFSGLFADANSGTYGSEIRLAVLHDNQAGTKHTIKGGSLSGSISEDFRKAYLSKNRVKHAYFESGTPGTSQGYYGPDCALLYNVSIAGN